MKSQKLRATMLGITAALVVAQAIGAAAFILWVPRLGLDLEPATPVQWVGASVLALAVTGTLGWLAAQLIRTASAARRDKRAGTRPRHLSSLAAVVATPLIVVNVVVALGMLPRLYDRPEAGVLVAALAASAVGLVWSARENGTRRHS